MSTTPAPAMPALRNRPGRPIDGRRADGQVDVSHMNATTRRSALHDISVQLGANSSAFIGPSGCGKSTFRALNR